MGQNLRASDLALVVSIHRSELEHRALDSLKLPICLNVEDRAIET